ncbi:FAD-binding oxidoreductase [Leucobacter coleopterorum]|uniref:FAD-binding oxidoreductase n=1 Tax=Leucobacter coleopterorum TaxID=2714933 RepID=UPI00244DC4E7|nr:FAD-binding oxidoreductase [Leucobacter coleopterorum]
MTAENGRANDDQPMRWNGWGDPERAKPLPRAVQALLPLLLGRVRKPATPAELASVQLKPTALSSEDLQAFCGVVGDDNVSTAPETRIYHAGGRSTPDLLQRRKVEQDAPDAVMRPGNHEEVRACLDLAAARKIAVIPFGGGTSVVGALDPVRGAQRAVVSLDLRRLSGLVSLDPVSGEAVLAAGTTGPEAEALLAEHGFELGHYPQSFRYATVGGFAAARSSGQNSAGYGRFDTMVTGIRVATPTGDLELGRSPGSAAGPDLIRVFLGSEGIFGVITEVKVRVHPVPQDRVFEAWSFPSFAAGSEGLRQVAQHASGPTVIRLSDEAETAVSLAQVGKIGKALAKGASVVTVYEGEGIALRRARTSELLRAAGGTSSGEGDAADWMRGASTAPICATRCSTLEFSARPSRRQQPGRICRNCAARSRRR